MGNIWCGKILLNHTGKAVGEEKFGEQAAVSAYAIHVFHVSVNIGEKNFGEWDHNLPNLSVFPQPKFSHVQYIFLLDMHSIFISLFLF